MRKIRDVVVYFSAFACAAALAAPAWAANSVTERIAGANRISTAVNVGLHCFPSTAKHVYLARQDVFADALAAGTLTDGPTLLVPRSGTAPAEVRQAVARMNPESVVALGGEGSVSKAVLDSAAQGRKTERLAGKTRFLTAIEITKRAFPSAKPSKVLLADGLGPDGTGSPDAVAGGTVPGAAILLAPRTDGAEARAVKAEIERLGGSPVRLGGAATFNNFQNSHYGIVSALQGNNRYATSVEIAKASNPNQVSRVYLTRGDIFADAVVAGCLTDGPVLLVAHSNTIPRAVAQYLYSTRPQQIVALGGEGSVPAGALQDAKLLAEGRSNPDNKPATAQGDSKKLRQISAGGDHTCAVAESGNLYCWGSNRFGQIGIGNASPNYGFDLGVDPLPETYHSFTGHNANVSKPALVSTLTNVVEVSSGLTHSCAYDAAGHAFCWGSNVTGQLGQGDTNSRTTPAFVPSLTGVTSIAAAGETNGPWSIRKDRADWIPTGTGHSCAVANGTVYCWGDNKWGQLGNGNKTSSPTPIAVSGIPQTAKKVVTGETYSCALTNNGDVYCWGTFRHDWGQGTNNQVAEQGYSWLANVSYADSLTPRQVTSVHGATELETGSYFACAKMGNSMHCWGYNSREQFFEDINPATMAPTNGQFPVHRHAQSYTASGWGSIKGFSLGRNSSCAIGPNSRVYCWGLNDAGQVGRSQSARDNDDSSVRIGIVGSVDTHVKAISVGWAHACAITGDGGARCWGYNPDGQLGNGQVFGARCTGWQVPGLGSDPYVPRDPHIYDCN